MGGTGKTRLALEVGGQLIEAYRGAVFFVPLAEVTEAAPLVEAILDTMGLERMAGIDSLTRVLQELARQPTLLLLDNFEQLVPEGVAVLQKLLEGAPRLTCLVTSRRTLNLAAEQEFPLGPLPTPESGVQAFRRSGIQADDSSPLAAEYPSARTPERPNARTPERLMQFPSVQLFVDRAQRVRPDFTVTRANAGAVAELCRGLEGMPLALELAAARAQVLTPAQLLQQLRRRLDVLVSRQQDVAARHRTLRAAIDWSYRLLTPELQALFIGLSVFRGGWTLEAAEQVCSDFGFWILDFGLGTDGPINKDAQDKGLTTGPIQNPKSKIQNHKVQYADPLDYLMQLRECSLILAEAGATEMRFRMLESLQQYAAEQLEASAERATSLLGRHAEYFHRFAAEQVEQLRTSGEAAGLERFEAELENVRAAMDWAQRAGRDELCARLALALGTYLQRRGFQGEAVQRIDAGLSAVRRLGAEQRLLGSALLRERAGLHLDLFEWAEARRTAGEARLLFEQSGDAHGIAEADNLLGLAAKGEKSYAEARRDFERARQQFERIGDPVGVAKAHSNLGVLGFTDPEGDREEAARHWRESLRLYRQCEDQRGIAEVLNNLGVVAQERGALDEARQAYDEALQIERELRGTFGIGRALSNLGEVAELQGDVARACRLFAAAEAIFADLGSPYQEYTAGLVTRSASRLGYTEADMASLREALRDRSEEERVQWALADEREC
jgi:predicted ATPase